VLPSPEKRGKRSSPTRARAGLRSGRQWRWVRSLGSASCRVVTCCVSWRPPETREVGSSRPRS
jgi:hypothetical protein